MPKLMIDKLIVVPDSIVHLLPSEQRPMINHINPARLIDVPSGLSDSLCYNIFIFLINVYTDMRIKQNVAWGSGIV